MPYFFLSYASADGDGYVDRFYRDLCEAVRARTGHPADDVGFRDRSGIAVGATWPHAISAALASARVLVAVCSPSYFASETCGKEWQLFTELTRRRAAAAGGRTDALLPIVWIPTASPPEVARRIQHTHEGFGATYRREGLHFIARLHRYRDDYHMFVVRLAERIVEAAGDAPLPPPVSVPDLTATRNAFEPSPGHPPAPVRAAAGAATPPATARDDRQPAAAWHAYGEGPVTPGGPRHVTFVVVAAPSAEVAAVRRDLRAYGPGPFDWVPYRPASGQRIAVFAQNVASARDLTSALRSVEQPIAELLAQARRRNEIVVLLVDVWSTSLEPYRRLLADYDERNAPATAVLVPWNAADGETSERSDELRQALCHALPNNTARGDTVYRPSLPTIAAFREALEEVLAEAQARVFKLGAVTRHPGAGRAVERPLLGRPGEAGVP